MAWFDRLLDRFFNWRAARQLRRECFHHDRRTGVSWVEGFLVDLGRSKHFQCTNCGQYWT